MDPSFEDSKFKSNIYIHVVYDIFVEIKILTILDETILNDFNYKI